MIIDASYGSPPIKPAMWGIDPGIVAYNASRMGLPMPVGLWPMWEGSGDKIYDLSGNGVDGATVIGGFDWVPGGIYFNGDSVDVGNKPCLDFSTEFTIVLGHKFNGNVWDRLLSKSDTHNSKKAYDFFISGENTYYFRLGNGVVSTEISGPIITNGVIYNMAVTFDVNAQKIKWYNNGILEEEDAYVAGALAADTANLYIASDGVSHLDGTIYYLYLFSKAFTSSQVATISADRYGLVRQPSMEELWAYYEAVVGVAPTGVLYGPLFGPLGGPV